MCFRILLTRETETVPNSESTPNAGQCSQLNHVHPAHQKIHLKVGYWRKSGSNRAGLHEPLCIMIIHSYPPGTQSTF